MDDAALVGSGEGGGDVAEHRLGRVDGEWPGVEEPFGHAAARHVLHDEVRRAVGQFTNAVDGDDVRVRDGGDRLCFAAESRMGFGVAALCAHEDLYGDKALELWIAPEVDATHAALPDDLEEQYAGPEFFLKRDGGGVVFEIGNGVGRRRPGEAGHALRYGCRRGMSSGEPRLRIAPEDVAHLPLHLLRHGVQELAG